MPSPSTLFVLDEMIDEPATTAAAGEVKPSSSLSEPNYLYAIPQHCSRDSASPDPPAERSAPRQRQTAVSNPAARPSDPSSRNNHNNHNDASNASNPAAPVQTGLLPRPPPQKIFRKSLSDPTVLRTTAAAGNRSRPRPLSNGGRSGLASDATDEDQGPWTSEALDLFDWWPPGRPKPV
ncbi:hypothetical protein VTN02DRAFT_4718 [Thermoascus thermophilus]